MMTPAQDLCTTCGLCCDGSLFKKASVQSGEEDRVRAVGLVVSASDAGKSSFPQPCRHFCNRQCGIYDTRPPVCVTYRCALLLKLDRGEVALPEALATVAHVRALQAHLKELIPEGPAHPINIYDARKHQAGLPQATPEDRQANASQLMALVRYVGLLKAAFVPSKQSKASDSTVRT